MNTKKPFPYFYLVTALVLAAAVILPARNFGVMLYIIHRGLHDDLPVLFSVSSVIPFLAVFVAVFIGFICMPLLWKLSAVKRRVAASVLTVAVLFSLGFFVEHTSLALDNSAVGYNATVNPSRHSIPAEVLEAYGVTPGMLQSAMLTRSGMVLLPDGTWFTPWRYLQELDTTSPGFISAPRFDVFSMYIPWYVKLHYYIFSAIFVLAVVNFLYGLAHYLYGGSKVDKKGLVLHGVSTGCYALAYFLVRAVRYENHALLHITWGSVLNAAVCFILAAVAAGLFCHSFVRHEKRKRILPPVISMLTVLALYGAQYAMLGGHFYMYSENLALDMLLRVCIVVVPGVIVSLLLHRSPDDKTKYSCR